MSVSVAQAQIFFLAFTRVMAILIHIPMLGGQSIPNQVRIGLGLILAGVLIRWEPLSANVEAIALFPFVVAIGREIIIGTLVGFAANLTFGAIQMAAELMGLGSGFGAGRILNPALMDPGSAFDQLIIMVSFLLFMIMDGHHSALIALQRTFIVLPVNSPLPELSVEVLLRTTSQLIVSGLQMALPVLAALLLTDLTLGLLARVAPQIQVFFLGMPLKMGISLIMLTLLLRAITLPLTNLFHSLGQRMLLLLGEG
jgi:flagellar biosynthesis protein FliR